MMMLPQQDMRPRLIPSWLWRVLLVVWHIISHASYDILEFVMGIGVTGWGLWVMNPLSDTFATSPTYDVMARLAPEAVWGAAVTVLGLAQLVGLVYRVPRFRRVTYLLLVATWFFISYVAALANFQSVTTWVYTSMFALSETLIYWRFEMERGRWRGQS